MCLLNIIASLVIIHKRKLVFNFSSILQILKSSGSKELLLKDTLIIYLLCSLEMIKFDFINEKTYCYEYKEEEETKKGRE